MDYFKRVWFAGKMNGGQGGWRCPCCGPRGKNAKKKARRYCRRVIKQADKKELTNDQKNNR